eukprot:4249270-Pleurochrysis_carterae.AAC.1
MPFISALSMHSPIGMQQPCRPHMRPQVCFHFHPIPFPMQLSQTSSGQTTESHHIAPSLLRPANFPATTLYTTPPACTTSYNTLSTDTSS